MNRKVALLLLLILMGCIPKWNLPIDGHIKGWYSKNDHQILHIYIEELPTSQGLIDTVNWAIDLTSDYLIPNHGLYLVFETIVDGRQKCAFVIGLTYESIHTDLNPQLLHPSLTSHCFNYHWPSHLDDKNIVLGYAWLLGLSHREIHPWFPELVGDGPKPLDSDFAKDLWSY